MGDMTGGSGTMATWLPEVWSMKPTITYRSNLVAVPLLDHTWEPEIGVGRGDTVNIPGFAQNNAARNRGAGTGTFGTGAGITFDAVSESQTQLIVNRFYYKAFRQPVEAAEQAMPSYTPLLIGGQGQAIALQVDADIFADGSDGFDTFSTIVGTDNVDITDDDLIELETNLNNNNAPVNDRFLAISPASRGSLLKIEAIRNSLYAGTIGNIAGSMGPGFLGPVLTFQVHMTNNLEAGTSGTKNFGWQREAVAFAEQISVRTERDLNIEDGVFMQYISFQTCGFKVIKSNFANELAGK